MRFVGILRVVVGDARKCEVKDAGGVRVNVMASTIRRFQRQTIGRNA
jgi:hypothetical protein